MATKREVFQCPVCGFFVMPDTDFLEQLRRANDTWHCPSCTSDCDHYQTQFQCEAGHWWSDDYDECPVCLGNDNSDTIVLATADTQKRIIAGDGGTAAVPDPADGVDID